MAKRVENKGNWVVPESPAAMPKVIPSSAPSLSNNGGIDQSAWDTNPQGQNRAQQSGKQHIQGFAKGQVAASADQIGHHRRAISIDPSRGD
jgi:hypothetical protein